MKVPGAPSAGFGSRAAVWLAAGIVVLAALVAYRGSFSGPFVLDDIDSILGNPTIRRLWPLTGPLSPPRTEGMTVEGRPLLNLTFALNYAISGTEVWSYHALNLLIHVAAGLVLFGVLRRTLRLLDYGEGQATWLGFAVSLLWAVHPLQTEAVTYIVQRAESLMGLFYLLTLYTFVRAATSHRALLWAGLSWLACLLGMATKEVMVSAPVIVFLYDRTFLAGTFREAWRKRWGAHLALASTWIPLGILAWGAGTRGGTSGFGLGVSPWAYWATQFPAVLRYLGLAVWPHPLVFDYGTQWVTQWKEVALPAIATAAIAAVAIDGFFRSGRAARALGFAGVFFFAILAPTSLVPGTRQTMAEQRMYLALAPVLAVIVLGAARVPGLRRARAWAPALGAAAALGVALTGLRNRDYRSAVALYADNVAKLPGNPYAQANLGAALFAAGRTPEAALHDEEALRLKPDYPDAEDNLGNALLRLGRFREAAGHYEAAVRLDPGFADAHSNLAGALARLGRVDEAAAQCREALRLNPDDIEAWNNLGNLLAIEGRASEAVPCYERALGLDPGYAAAHYNLGNALWRLGRIPEAIESYREALRLRPDFLPAAQRLRQLEALAPAPEGASRPPPPGP